jgi:hypothetical protein
MSIGSRPAAASVASDIISAALADLSSMLMASPVAPYAARLEHRPAIPDLTVVNRPRSDKAGRSRSERT